MKSFRHMLIDDEAREQFVRDVLSALSDLMNNIQNQLPIFEKENNDEQRN